MVEYYYMNKRCSHCHQNLPVEEFGNNKVTPDGLTRWCKPCIKVQSREQYLKDREARLARGIKYQRLRSNQKKEYDRLWRLAHREELAKRDAVYYQDHKEEIHAKQRTRRAVDPIFKLVGHLRTRLYNILRQKSLVKRKRMPEYLGCTLEQLRAHLESQFTPGMTWENQGKWHLDHILPLNPKEPISEEEIYKRCHYTNLQPLWGSDNLRKSNKLSEDL